MTLSRRLALLLVAPALVLAASACTPSDSCPKCQDVVTGVPWQAGEKLTYSLTQDSADKGETQLVVEKDGANFVLRQLSHDEKGNSDSSSVTVDAATLKPASGTREIIDSTQRTVLTAAYESGTKDCDAGLAVQIKQEVYKPPSAEKPDSTRSNPLCITEHSYDNDTSLFVWRTIKFEKGYTVMYRTVLTGRRTTQIVTLTVRDQERITTPAGDFDAWFVEIAADQSTQQAWFATSDDHRLLRYDNANLTFMLKQ